MENLTNLAKVIHQNNVDKGFYDGPERNMGEVLALIHSEVSEALEAHRKGIQYKGLLPAVMADEDQEFKQNFEQYVKGTFEDELADILIRVLDLCGWKKISIQTHVDAKLRYNKLRPYKHGKKY